MARIYGIAWKTSTAIGPRMNALVSNAGRDRYVRPALSHPHPAGNTLTGPVWTCGDPAGGLEGVAAVGDARRGPAVAGASPRLVDDPGTTTEPGRGGVSKVGRGRTRGDSLSRRTARRGSGD